MWTCQKCGRIFEKEKQPHSCHQISLEQHFKNKNETKKIFDCLVKQIHSKIGTCRIIPIPCCVHVFGTYDFLAALPKKDRLEIRFALDRKLDSPRLKQCVPMSTSISKNCIDVAMIEEIDGELMRWLGEAYHLKDKKK